jgi:hypothetical protein
MPRDPTKTIGAGIRPSSAAMVSASSAAARISSRPARTEGTLLRPGLYRLGSARSPCLTSLTPRKEERHERGAPPSATASCR